jgi:hypothetical protein
MFDLDSWLHCSASLTSAQLAGARKALWEVIMNTTGVPLVAHSEQMFFIPTNSRNPRCRSFKSAGLKTPLPASVPPILSENKKKVIYILMEDLILHFGVGIHPCPSLERGVVTHVSDSMHGRLVLMGASHINRLAGVMDAGTVSLAYQGFRPREPMISEITNKLKALNFGKLDTVVMDLLSTLPLWALMHPDYPPRRVRAEGRKYHITGSLTVAPPTLTKKVLSDCLPLAAALKGTGTVLLSPVPCYVYEKCCKDPQLIENFEDPDLDEEIIAGLEGIKRQQLQNWWAENNLLFSIIDPTLLSDSCDLSLKTRVASDGHPPWATGDPIHLTATACQDLATVIGESVLAGAAGDSASEAGSSSHSQKRKRIEVP